MVKTRVHLIRGQPYFVFSIEDIRVKIDYERQQESRQQDMLQLASILHDLKTPLNCISGTSQIFKILIEEKQPDLMGHLKNFDLSLDFIFSMIEDIQDLAKFSGN